MFIIRNDGTAEKFSRVGLARDTKDNEANGVGGYPKEWEIE